MSRFEDCLAFTWRPENDGQPLHVTAHDAGGATAWGVTLSSYASWRADHGIHTTTEADLAAASKVELSDLIYSRYWMAVAADQLPPGVDLLCFDFGYTSGPGTSAKLVQEIIGGLKLDGQLGPVTLAAAARVDRLDLIRRLGARYEAYYRSLSDFDDFGRGWTARNNARLQLAIATPAATPASAPVAVPAHLGLFASWTNEVRHALGS